MRDTRLRYRLGTGMLIERAHRIIARQVSSGTPNVAALCLRIAHHAEALGVLETSSAVLNDWATHQYLAWCTSLNNADLDVIKATLASDPVNLLLGGLCLPDESSRERVLDTYLACVQRFKEQGVSAVASGNVPLVNRLFNAVGRSGAVIDLPSPPDTPLASSAGIDEIAQRALCLTSFGSRSMLVSQQLRLEPIIEAHLVNSARICDLNSSGSALLAAALFGIVGERLQDLVAWLSRMIRSDGLVGHWDFYGDLETKANLMVTANAYWGLHAACRPEIPLYPGMLRVKASVNNLTPAVFAAPGVPSIDLHRCEQVGHSLCKWLEENLARFTLLPACKDRTSFDERFKPLTEICLVIFMLTRSEQLDPCRPFVAWARRMTVKLEAHLDWEGLLEEFRLHATNSIGLMCHVLLEQITGRPSRFHDELTELLQHPLAKAKERAPMRQMEFHMACHLHGLDGALAALEDDLSRTLLACACDPLYFSNNDAYDITHAVIYALALGRISDSAALAQYRPWLRKHLPDLTLASMMDCDFDLGGEFLICRVLDQQELDVKFALSVALLLNAPQANGSISGPAREIREEMDAFDRCYHTSLVCLVALSEVLRVQ